MVVTIWHNILITGLRILLDDPDGNAYSDYELEYTLAVAAAMVQQEVNLATTYDINVNPPSISPDPIVNKDRAFVNLVYLKAACLLDRASLGYNKMSSGLKAKIGNVYLSTFGKTTGLGSMIDNGYCLSYETAKRQYNSGTSRNKSTTLSPFKNRDFDPFDYKR